MSAILEQGQFTIEDDGTDLLIKDSGGNVVYKLDDSASELEVVGALSVTGNLDVGGRTLDTDSDGILENADVDGLVNFGASDAFSQYPIAENDVSFTTGLQQVATGTVTATGGSSPAVNTTLQSVSADQLLDYDVWVYVDADPAFAADYAFNFDYSHSWDDTNSELDIDLVVNWDTDPGSSNDVTLRWEVVS